MIELLACTQTLECFFPHVRGQLPCGLDLFWVVLGDPQTLHQVPPSLPHFRQGFFRSGEGRVQIYGFVQYGRHRSCKTQMTQVALKLIRVKIRLAGQQIGDRPPQTVEIATG